MLHRYLLLAAFLPALVWAEENKRQIVVSATGVTTVAPDMATISIGVEREARTAEAAMAAMTEASAAVLAEVAEAGVEPMDVQTASINLYPVWDQNRTSGNADLRGFTAATMIQIRVRDLERLGQVLDRLVREGANRMNGLRFGIADVAPVEALARAGAVRRAADKAATLAEAAGVTLGPVQTIAEGAVGRSGPPMMMEARMESASVPVAAGELDVRVSVSVTYAIAD